MTGKAKEHLKPEKREASLPHESNVGGRDHPIMSDKLEKKESIVKRCPLKHPNLRLLLLAPALLALVLVGGCGARLNQFKSFSEAGIVYSAAMVDFTGAAGQVSIDASSIILEKTRFAHGPGQRVALIKDDNQVMEERLAILGDIQRHTLLLKAYFEAIGALAGSNIGTQIASDTSGIVSQLGKLNPSISNAPVGGATIGSLVGPVTGLVVQGVQQAALEQELKTNANTINNELALQEEAVAFIAQTWKSDMTNILNRKRSLNNKQFIRGSALPLNWAAQRRASLTANSSIALADSATKAAKKLRQAFAALVENRLTAEDIPLLLNDIDQIVTLLELVRKDSGTSA